MDSITAFTSACALFHEELGPIPANDWGISSWSWARDLSHGEGARAASAIVGLVCATQEIANRSVDVGKGRAVRRFGEAYVEFILSPRFFDGLHLLKFGWPLPLVTHYAILALTPFDPRLYVAPAARAQDMDYEEGNEPDWFRGGLLEKGVELLRGASAETVEWREAERRLAAKDDPPIIMPAGLLTEEPG